MISGAPLSSTPVAAALTHTSGSSNQTFATTVTSTWTVPAPTMTVSAVSFTTAVNSTWTVPTPTVVSAGSITVPAAEFDWTVPAPTLSASGAATFTTAVTAWVWSVPGPTFTGGIQGHGNIATLYELLGEPMPKFNKQFAITKSDTVNFPWLNAQGSVNGTTFPCDAIYVGGAGDVVGVLEDYSTVTLAGATAGSYLPGRFIRVNSTNTTATNLVACFNV